MRVTCRVGVIIAAAVWGALAPDAAQADTRTGTLTVTTSQPAGTLTIGLSGTTTANVAAHLPAQVQLSGPRGGIASVSVTGPAACTASRCGIAQSALLDAAALGAPPPPGYAFTQGI